MMSEDTRSVNATMAATAKRIALAREQQRIAHTLFIDRAGKFGKNAPIFTQGFDADALYYVEDGSLIEIKESIDAEPLAIGYHFSGDIIGADQFFSEDGAKRVTTLISLTPVRLRVISYKRARLLMARDAADIYNLLGRALSKQFSKLSEQAYDLAYLDVRSRTANMLQRMAQFPTAQSDPDGVRIKITRRELATNIAACREMVGRTLQAMHDENELHVRGKTITIKAPRPVLNYDLSEAPPQARA